MECYLKDNRDVRRHRPQYDTALLVRTIEDAGGRNCKITRRGDNRGNRLILTFEVYSELGMFNVRTRLDRLDAFRDTGSFIMAKDW